MTARRLVFVIVASGFAGHAFSQDATGPGSSRAAHFDESTGRDLLNYPRHPLADYVHMRLDLTIADMNVPRMEAVQRLTVRAVRDLDALTLDARGLDVLSVLVEGRAATHRHDGDRLTVTFSPPLRAGEKREIMTAYTVNDPPDGLYWTLADPAWPGRASQVHSQGEPEMNSFWFPCHDYPNDRMTTEVVATVPGGFTVSSNGRLIEHERDGESERWHWMQDKPHVPYLVTLVVGRFDVVDVGTRSLPMPVYVPPGRGRDVRGTYGRTAEMVRFFERRFDEPYPWDRYAQVLVWNFNWGGMENTAATTMYDTAVISREALNDHSLEGLISHELAHQWFGNLVTCRSWEHIWLNEGWATYCEALWEESKGGRAAYDAEIIGNFGSVIADDIGHAPYQPPMVSKEYRHADDVFGRESNPYPKGAAVLHMLRRRLGDEVFFRAAAEYLDEFKFAQVETGDLRRTFERVSGESLEQFFEQWCYRPGIPRLSVSLSWDGPAGVLRAHVEQTQHIDARNPAFAFTLPLRIHVGGEILTLEVPIDGRVTTFETPLRGAPRFVAVDPDLHVLAAVSVAAPSDWSLAQLEGGDTLPSRLLAARALGTMTEADDGGRLAAVARSERAPVALRREAITALKARRDSTALAMLADKGLRDPGVREHLVAAVGEMAAADAALWSGRRDWFIRVAARDASQRTRAAAVRVLGASRDTGVLSEVLAATARESQDDRVRLAAANALADLDLPEALPAAVELTSARYLGRTRAVAAGAVGRLGRHDAQAAYNALRPLLAERFNGLRNAAGAALVELADARALADFQRLIDSARTPWDRDAAESWKRSLEVKLGSGAAAATSPALP